MGALQDLIDDKILEARLAEQQQRSYDPQGMDAPSRYLSDPYDVQGQEGSTPYDEDMLARIQELMGPPADTLPARQIMGSAPAPAFSLQDLLSFGSQAPSQEPLSSPNPNVLPPPIVSSQTTPTTTSPGTGPTGPSLLGEYVPKAAMGLADLLGRAGNEIYSTPVYDKENFERGIQMLSDTFNKKGALASGEQFLKGMEGQIYENPEAAIGALLAGSGLLAKGAGYIGGGKTLAQGAKRVASETAKLAAENPVAFGVGSGYVWNKFMKQKAEAAAEAEAIAAKEAAEAEKAAEEAAKKEAAAGGAGVPGVSSGSGVRAPAFDRAQIREMLGLDKPGQGKLPMLVAKGDRLERVDARPQVGGSYARTPGAETANERYKNIIDQVAREDPRVRVAEAQATAENAKTSAATRANFARTWGENMNRLGLLGQNNPNMEVTIGGETKKVSQLTHAEMTEAARQQAVAQTGFDPGGLSGGALLQAAAQSKKKGKDIEGEEKGTSDALKILLGGGGLFIAHKMGATKLVADILRKNGLLKALPAAKVAVGEGAPLVVAPSAAKEWAELLRAAPRPAKPQKLLPYFPPAEVPPGPTKAAADFAARLRGVKVPEAGPQGRLPYLPSKSTEYIIPKETTTNVVDEFVEPTRKAIAEGYLPKKGTEEYKRLNRIKAVFRERAQLPAVRDAKSNLQYQTIEDVRNFSRKELEARLRNLKRAAKLEEDIPGVPYEDLQDHIQDLQEYLRKNKKR